MASEQNPNHDYIIFDQNGYKKIIDGKEFPATKEDIISKEHTGCLECTFVQDKQKLFIYFVAKDLKNKAGRNPFFIGKYSMTGWVGHSSFYLFKCSSCGYVGIDYPHGYVGNFMYLRCDSCKNQIVLKPSNYKEVYQRDNLHIPQEATRKEKKEMAKLLKSRLKKTEGAGMGTRLNSEVSRKKRSLLEKALEMIGLKS